MPSAGRYQLDMAHPASWLLLRRLLELAKASEESASAAGAKEKVREQLGNQLCGEERGEGRLGGKVGLAGLLG